MSKDLSRKLAIIEPGSLLVVVNLAQDKNVTVVINQQAQRLAKYSESWRPLQNNSYRQQL